MIVEIRELKDKFQRRFFLEAKCNICKMWETYSRNQVPIYTDHRGSIVVCYQCKQKV